VFVLPIQMPMAPQGTGASLRQAVARPVWTGVSPVDGNDQPKRKRTRRSRGEAVRNNSVGSSGSSTGYRGQGANWRGRGGSLHRRGGRGNYGGFGGDRHGYRVGGYRGNRGGTDVRGTGRGFTVRRAISPAVFPETSVTPGPLAARLEAEAHTPDEVLASSTNNVTNDVTPDTKGKLNERSAVRVSRVMF
jgi:hypothetical protein